MGVNYQTVLWNKNKKKYDRYILIGVLLYIMVFSTFTLVFYNETSIETLIIRCFGTLALALLHIILVIGPLCRLNSNFLPLLYNRRHLGVTMFFAGLVHGGFSLFQFHGLGNTTIFYSLFTSNLDYDSLINFPFQVLGFFALIIFYLMAATSHDFWIKNLSPKVWKSLHFLVYLAYVLIIFHVFLGAFQQKPSWFTVIILGGGFLIIAILHLVSSFKNLGFSKAKKIDKKKWLYIGKIEDIKENRAKIFTINKEKVAIFKYDNKLSAISNVCKHQGGPLGEGKIIDGCVTCPWHGYQYFPHNGQSPPPFTEKIATYRLKKETNKIFIFPEPLAEGTSVKPLKL